MNTRECAFRRRNVLQLPIVAVAVSGIVIISVGCSTTPADEGTETTDVVVDTGEAADSGGSVDSGGAIDTGSATPDIPKPACHTGNDGALCDDGDPCTAEDRCKSGTCAPGPSICECQKTADCADDGDLCNGVPLCKKTVFPFRCVTKPGSKVVCSAVDGQCEKTQCDASSGKCVATPVPNGTPCNDGDPCTVESACEVTGDKSVCKPGKASWCACQKHTDCVGLEDGDLCNGTLYCEKSVFPWRCRVNPKTVVTCPAGKDKACHLFACDKKTGKCAHKPMTNGTVCNDGKDETIGETCQAGVCTPSGNTAKCEKHSDCKDDGNKCNGLPFCNKAAQQCEVNPATVIQCPTVADTACVKNQCVPVTGSCLLTPLADASKCDDGDKCSLGDFCLGGKCKPGTGFACKCKTDADCSDKDDGNKCNGLPFCNKASGKCETNPVTVVTCKTVNDTACKKAACVPKTGVCELANLATGTGCNDGDACTKGETCSGGKCEGTFVCGCASNADCPSDGNACNGIEFCDKAANPPVCSASKASIPKCPAAKKGSCVGSACSPTSGKCVPTPVAAGSACDDGNPCTANAFCQGVVCVGGVSTCECDKAADCLKKDDGDLCNGVFYCDKSGAKPQCKPNPASKVFCPKTSTSACLENRCFPKTGTCGLQPTKTGTACDDGTICTTKDACKDGKCAGSAKTCDDGNICTTDSCDPKIGCQHKLTSCNDGNDCTLDKCDPKTGKCGFDASARDGFVCNGDDDACTVNDVCSKGACKTGIQAPCTLPTKACEVAKCIGKGLKTHKCAVVAKPEDTPCGDGKTCKLGARCKTGKCAAGTEDRFFKRTFSPDSGQGAFNAVGAGLAGGYIAVGQRGPTLASKGANAWWIVGLSGSGKQLWQLSAASKASDSTVGANAVIAPGDGTIVVFGSTATTGQKMQGQGLWLKPATDPSKPPTVTATKLWGGTKSDEYIHAAAVSTAGTFLVVGREQQAYGRPWASQLSNIGQPQWSMAQGGNVEGTWLGAVSMADGSWLVSGWRRTSKTAASTLQAMRIDKTGKAAWTTSYPRTSSRYGGALAQLGDASFAIVGWHGVGAAARPVQLAIDAGGKLAWDRTGASAGFVPYAVVSRGKGHAAMAGRILSSSTGKSDAWIDGLDKLGNTAWTVAHDAGGDDVMRGLLPMADGGLLAAGFATVNGKRQALLVRTSAFGHLGCDAAGSCRLKAVDGCDDGKPCTRDLCVGTKGCLHVGQPGAVCGIGGGCALTSVCKADKCVAGPDQKLFAKAATSIDGLYSVGTMAPDGGYAVANAKGKAFNLALYSSRGEPLWSRTYTTNVAPYLRAICRRPGGGFVLLGRQNNKAFPWSPRIYVVGTDATGKQLWTYVGYNGFGDSCRALPSGEILVGAIPLDVNQRTLLRLSAAGQLVWSRTAKGKYSDGTYVLESAQSIAAGGGSDSIIAGAALHGPVGAWKGRIGWLSKVNAAGSAYWSRRYGKRVQKRYDELLGVAQMGSGYLATARIDNKPRVVAFDGKGNLLWSKTTGSQFLKSFAVASDGSIVASAAGKKDGNAALRIVRWKPAGGVLFDRTFLLGYQTLSRVSPVVAHSDGGFSVFAQASIGPLHHPAIVRMDANGHASCDTVGKCGKTPNPCDDKDACTADACDGKGGCKHVASGHCDDGDACTVNVCTKPGTCAKKPRDCDDGNKCTTDSCTKLGWDQSGCVHTPISCKDGHVCTDDKCDPKTGCVFPQSKDGAACSDTVCGGGAGQCIKGDCVTLNGGTTPGCTMATAKALCGDIKKANPVAIDGWYWLDVDGTGPLPPKRFYCYMKDGWTLWSVNNFLSGNKEGWVSNAPVTKCTGKSSAAHTLGPFTPHKKATVGRIFTDLPPHSEARVVFLVYTGDFTFKDAAKFVTVKYDGIVQKPQFSGYGDLLCNKVSDSNHFTGAVSRVNVVTQGKHTAKSLAVVGTWTASGKTFFTSPTVQIR